MKRITGTCMLLLACLLAAAQNSGMPQVDKSPMDASYYPNNYPILKIQNKTTDSPVARVIYSRPQKNGRTVFGNLIEYGQVWRMGANEATELQLYQSVHLGRKKVPSGRYTLYALVEKDKWTIIINKETDTWGAFNYDADRDLARLEVPVEQLDKPVEYLSMMFEPSGTDTLLLVIEWDQVKVSVPFTL